jgi:hypothetical protein
LEDTPNADSIVLQVEVVIRLINLGYPILSDKQPFSRIILALLMKIILNAIAGYRKYQNAPFVGTKEFT